MAHAAHARLNAMSAAPLAPVTALEETLRAGERGIQIVALNTLKYFWEMPINRVAAPRCYFNTAYSMLHLSCGKATRNLF
mgnify:CR=1 FL=1